MRSEIMHGDCIELLPTIHGNSVQTIFIDPPYNIGIDYGSGAHADRLPASEYLGRMETLLGLCLRTLTDTGSMWLLTTERWADEMGTMLTGLLPRRNRIIWRETFGQYHERRFPSGHRHLFWHVKDLNQTPFLTDHIRIPSQRMLDGDQRAKGPRVPDDVWEIPRLVGNAGERTGKHPCQLPEDLLRRVIRCSTQEDDCVLDPMAGTGTTLRVAQCHRRHYIGIEQQRSFVDDIRQRLAQPYHQELFS